MGGTVFEAGDITCELDDGLMISASALNSLRREIIEEIEKRLIFRTK